MKKNNEGITLVSLIVTIIIILIIAGIAVSMIGGENGILAKAKYASASYQQEQVKELLESAISSWKIDKIQNSQDASLASLKEISLSDSTVTIGELQKVICVDTNGEKYYYLIDENFNLTNIDSQTAVSTTDNNINDYNINYTVSGTVIKVDTSNITTKDGSNIEGYLYLLNDVNQKTTSETTFNFIGLSPSTQYKISVIAVDKYGNTKKKDVNVTTGSGLTLYDNGIINTAKITGFIGVHNSSCSYEIGSTFLRTYAWSSTYNDGAIYTTNKVDFEGYHYLKAEISTGSSIGGYNGAMLLAYSSNTSSYPVDAATYKSSKISTNNTNNITVTVDISAITTPQYIGLFGCMQEVKFHKIWLE